MTVNSCCTCFNETKDPSEEPCNSCRSYSNWVAVNVFKNIDNHGEYMVARNALDVQVAGSHYKKHGIQPVEYIHTNKIGYFEGNVIKYVTRWRDKGGIADLEKAKHYIDLLIELEGKNNG